MNIAEADDLRLKELPAPLADVDTDEYQLIEVDFDSPLFSESLVDVAECGIATEPFYARSDGLNAPVGFRFPSASSRVYLRASVVDRLKLVNGFLADYGVELLVWDGYRPVALQKELWDWMLAEAAKRFPLESIEMQTEFALRFASNPTNFDADDPQSWPTHSTGGAVDLTLREVESKIPLHMGGIYLDPSDLTATRFYDSTKVDDPATHQEAMRNRRLLFWSMSKFGFVNYAFEWWHFDYHTQAWVMNQGAPSELVASYGVANQGQVI